MTLPQVSGDFCPACDEYILDAPESRRITELMLAKRSISSAALRR
jgi:hypothetical protein